MMQLGEEPAAAAATAVLETSSGEALPPDSANGVVEKGRDDGGGDGGGDEEGDKIGSGGSRWPRPETLALLKIRSDMDAVFRDSSLKGPLWEEVSRKLAGLGYHRNAKKCKEKFENVYKYHKRTKESRSGKPEGKTYRFFDQLQALEKQFSLSYPPQPQLQPQKIQPSLPTRPNDVTTVVSHVTTTVPSTNLSPPPTIISPPPPQPPANAAATTTIASPTVVANPRNTSQAAAATAATTTNNNVSYSLPNMNLFSSSTNSTSSSTASDEDLEEKYRKKRKWKDYFRRLTRQVLSKQDELQKRFLEAIDKREREQTVQLDAWRKQEMERINREHELLIQERSTAAAKNAAVIAFLQKLSGQQSPTTLPVGNFAQQAPLQSQPQLQPQPEQQLQLQVQPQSQPQPPPQLSPPPPVSQQQTPQQPQQQQLVPHPLASNINMEIQSMNNGHNNGTPLSSSRWPKTEVHALIQIRTSLETKYQENGPKAPLWEEISAAMQRIGYNRNAKRCKEKWENINKYFKKVKESNKQRREDSKTCPYFHELEALYKEKSSKTQNLFGGNSFQNMRPNEMMEPLMVQPEQQWRPPPQYEESVKKNEGVQETKEREEMEEEQDYDEEEGEGEGDSMEEDEGENRYEIVTNKLSSVDTVE